MYSQARRLTLWTLNREKCQSLMLLTTYVCLVQYKIAQMLNTHNNNVDNRFDIFKKKN